jgi:hypothetical protein
LQNSLTVRGSWVTMMTVCPAALNLRCAPRSGLETRRRRRRNLVEHEDLPHRCERHRIREPRRHPARVVLQLEIRESFQLGKARISSIDPRMSASDMPITEPMRQDVVDRVEVGIPSDTERENRGDRRARDRSPGIGLVGCPRRSSTTSSSRTRCDPMIRASRPAARRS